MEYTYEEITDDFGGKVIKQTDADGIITWIPTDEANSDYKRYLRWVENPEAEEFAPTITE